MSMLNIYKTLHKKISHLVHSVDPAALGGAAGEYDKEVDQIIKIIMSEKRSLSTKEIKLLFSKSYGGMVSLTSEEIEILKGKIDQILARAYIMDPEIRQVY